MARVSNLARQFDKLRQALPKSIQRTFNANFGRMCEVIAGEMQEFIEVEVFKAQSEPSGKRWPRISPLTAAVRKKQGNPYLTLGGKKLPDSFKRGGRGNVFKIKGKTGFVFGSMLKSGRFLVGRTFAERYKMPKTPDIKGERTEKKVKSAKKRMEQKGARIRAFMVAMTGIPAPGRGKQLTHPARPLIYWTPKLEARMNKVIKRFMAIAFATAASNTSREVASVQAMLDAKHRTSEVG